MGICTLASKLHNGLVSTGMTGNAWSAGVMLFASIFLRPLGR